MSKDRKDNVHALSNNQLQTIGAILHDEAGLKKIISAAQSGSPVDVATFNDVADYCASRRASWQRGIIMNLLSVTDVQTIVNVLLGKSNLKRTTIMNKMVTGKQKDTGIKFFLGEDAKVVGVKSILGDLITDHFFPTSVSLMTAGYTPITTVVDGVSTTVHLHELTDAKQYDEIRKATYALVSNQSILNGDFELKINGKTYLSEEAIRPLGDAYRTDSVRGSVDIDTVHIAPKGTAIEAKIVMQNTAIPNDLIIALAISGVVIM